MSVRVDWFGAVCAPGAGAEPKLPPHANITSFRERVWREIWRNAKKFGSEGRGSCSEEFSAPVSAAGEAMPQLTAVLQVALLLSAVPAQYLISRWTSGTAAQRSLATQGILDTWKSVRKSYLNMTVWVDWLNSWMPSMPLFGEPEEELGKALAEAFELEMLMHKNDQGYFGVSEEPRSPRPEYVLHRVGEVVMETQNHMVGVIVGWDTGLRAPPEWIKRKKITDSEIRRLEDTPHYRILFSGPNQSSLLIGYLPQNAIQLLEGYQPDIPTLDHYFYHFDGRRFVMKDWLKDRYPED